MTTPIQIYTDEKPASEREWIPRDETGTGYAMTLKSLKAREDKDGCWKGIFEVGADRLYSQLFWENSTDIEMLRQLTGQEITCDIVMRGQYQRITNIELVEDAPAKQTTQEYLASIKPPKTETDEEVPF